MEKRKRILVVDDEETARVTLEVLLAKEGFDVTLAKNGREAIERIKQAQFDLALVDLVMPDINGMETLGEIKRISPKTNVIIITGFGTIDNAVEAVKKGAVNYVLKPFKKNEIQSIIKRALEEVRFEETVRGQQEDGFKIFKNLTSQGAPGLCITKQRPELVREKYGLETQIVGLTKLDELILDINNFIRENEAAVVLIDGIENLIDQNSLGTMKKFITELNDTMSLSNSRAIVMYNPSKIPAKLFNEFARLVTDPYTRLVSEILSHNLRRAIIRFLYDRKGSTFTSIKEGLDVNDPPKLSFHLRSLKSGGMLDQDSEKRYLLTQRGEQVHRLLSQLDDDGIKDMKNVLWIKSF